MTHVPALILVVLPAGTWISTKSRKLMAMLLAIENVRGIKIAINMAGMAIVISSQSRLRSSDKNLAAK